MAKGRMVFPILGLLCAVWPARASLSYYQTTEPNFSNQATVTDGLTLSSLITFTSADLTTDGILANDEYDDAADGIEFFAFSASGTTHEAFTVSGGALQVANGDTIEIEFTSAEGFGFNFTTTWSSGDNACEGPTVNGSCPNNVFISNGGSGFMGAINDNPLPAATMPTIWVYQVGEGSANTDIQSFYLATAGSSESAPEAGTLLTLGFGLVGIGVVRFRRIRRPR